MKSDVKKTTKKALKSKKMATFASENNGAMLEWLKRHAWKACIRQKRIASSNLAHSASNKPTESRKQ